jgi:glucose-6-phosphate isomerase
LRLDFAKTQIDDAALDQLIALLEKADVAGRREAMFTGAPINDTEGRAVLHTALRNLDGDAVMVDGVDVMHAVLATLDRMEVFAEAIRDGS